MIAILEFLGQCAAAYCTMLLISAICFIMFLAGLTSLLGVIFLAL